MGVSFDPTFRAGDVLNIVAFLVVGLSAFFNIKGKIGELFTTIRLTSETIALRFRHIDEALEEAKEIVKSSAGQDVQISQLRREVDQLWTKVNEVNNKVEELRHWKGFVNPSGEYRRDATPVKSV